MAQSIKTVELTKETKKKTKREALSGWPMILGWIAMLIFTFHASTHMVGAGDTWVAMACGRHFTNHGVDTIEPFSANSHRAGPTEEDIKKWPGPAKWIAEKVGLDVVKYWHPTGWVNQNWLTHVIFYNLVPKSTRTPSDTFSSEALVYWKFAIYVITVICVYYTGRILGVNPALSSVFACFAMFVGRSFLDVRPAGFSNMLMAVFLLTLVLTTYRNVLYIWLIVPVTIFWCNVHGGYLYVFIMLVPFVALNFLTIISKKRFVSIGLKGIYHTMGAGIAALVGTIIFNPFHLTNLTHTFVISVSEHAKMWRTVNEWHPAFEWSNPVGDEIPFLIMYIIVWVVFVVWAVVQPITSGIVKASSGRRGAQKQNKDEYQWPKIDLALIAIASLTIYMAIRSRRFIPIAGIAACPLIAMFIDQIVRSISATAGFNRRNRLAVMPMPREVELFFITLGVASILFFGTWWGLKFKRVYLDPWPTDTRFNTVFMRMTASDAKPFYALKFIKDNKLKGKMFNYWTEGGFIAWGQQPDPNTGRTPLRLFMDGRAQAAYEPSAYKLWSKIMYGGPTVDEARARGRSLNNNDYSRIGKWISEELRKRDVWVVLMPAGQFNKPFVMGLERNRQWPLVFLNNKQKLFVDATTEQGKKLWEGIFTGKTVYPNKFTKNIMLAHNFLLFVDDKNAKKRGLEFAIKALQIYPSQVPAQEILLASRFAELRPTVNEVCRHYLEDFIKNKSTYLKKDGYYHRLIVALMVSRHLEKVAASEKNTKLKEFYALKADEYNTERGGIQKGKRW